MVRIRQFGWDDHDAVVALWAAAGRAVVPRAELEAKLARDPELFLVAETQGDVVGVVMGTYDGRRGWILRLAVSPAHRRRGIAGQLVSELEQRFTLLGCPRVNLLVLPDNAAGLRFWQALGYLPMPDVLCTKPMSGSTRVHSMGVESDVREWLRQRGTETIEHPGGTLFAHLCRVQARLAELGYETDVQFAGLTHAAYGTDGFNLALLDWQDRSSLRDLIGADAEALVYLYGACDRSRSWRQLATTGEVTDRFTGQVVRLDPGRLTPFIDLSIVNELDVMDQDHTLVDKHGDYFRTLFAAWAPATSAPLAQHIRRLLD